MQFLLARGKPTAYFIVAVLVGLMAFVAVRSTGGPQLYKGDTLETRTCRWCQGSGEFAREGGALGKCPGCQGSKTVQVILPGPEHPAPVRGNVSDNHLPVPDDRPEERGKLPHLLKGGIPDARLSFKGPESLEITSQAGGRYKCSLKPGDYTVKVNAPGFKELSWNFTVPLLKNPIWEERARKLDGPEAADTVVLPLTLEKNP